MRVHCKLYATLRAYLPEEARDSGLEVELPEGATLADLLQRLGVPPDEVKTAFVNGRVRPENWSLQSGDRVGVFPPIGGG